MTPVDTSERPVVLVWEVTQACALACDHCRASARPQRHPSELSTAEGKQLLTDAAAFGDGQLVVLSGGDPLARPDTVELVEHGTDCGLRMTVTPSGTASLTPTAIEALADAGVAQFAVSIDGATPTAHDEFRGEAGSFERTLRAARAIRELGVPLQVNTTVCADTVEALPAIRDLVAELGVALWSVFFLVPVGRGRALDPVSPARAEEVMAWLDGVARSEAFGVKTTEAPMYRRVRAQRGGDGAPQRRAGVTAGDGFAFVSHTGAVYPSGFLPSSAGNVRERSVVDSYRNSELFQRLRDTEALMGKCGACSFRNVCGGSRSRAYATTGEPMASDPLCPHVPDGYDGPLPDRQATADD
ncbi:radical SAM protein [Halobacterium salinarum]|uniref:Coproheme decarboxylase AhbD n=1 Tax=Halobacterium salinarum (strain ATCC 33171 / DSM 3754 / JCM 8978 / NBRC 102687 / NCIMB 764 / 91-R6) TaxID=2597657 RepID=A0A4D6GV76_HALS9|nr:radical SAM protein [Halobacterium salinarum]QCC45006.1 coproheme decarboxylase AhbD [Halobacterium salinarum]TYO76119.1 radical SAM additional 4Fe4S-binding SPASM domain-containing protein [Halobacterium salinarum DSM 3754]